MLRTAQEQTSAGCQIGRLVQQDAVEALAVATLPGAASLDGGLVSQAPDRGEQGRNNPASASVSPLAEDILPLRRPRRFLEGKPVKKVLGLSNVTADVLGVPQVASQLALYGAYPEKQGGSAMRLTFPFTFPVQAMSAIREALKLAGGCGAQPAGELRSEAIQSGFAEELLRARGLKSPLGEVRARADLVPR